MSALIRPARPEDGTAIASVGRESFTWAFGHLYEAGTLARYLEATYSPAKIARSLAKPSNTYFVAEVEGRVLGFLKLKEACPHPSATGPGTPWQTQKLYVDPGTLRSGLGRQLMLAGEAWMRTRGAGSTWLVVYQGNASAIRFYESLGFRQVGVEFHDFEQLRVEFKLMEKCL
ncbi:GNAT family N-acetyltransferase [Geothrix sp.]|jgi:ribosomal protein S18 acetylase RimI-like enzyme|uniref:GNAT family N-acetyltransferase n=1 Tax=Geothrix sp. TaxID=1962974 RepID=UPI0025B8BF45|nr:GNAT family N-acetyltransferase [Geothrix sp.]